MNSVLLISHDLVGAKMAGPGIRYFNLARVLAKHVHLTLAIPNEASSFISQESGINIVQYKRSDWSSLQPHTQDKQVIILPGDIASDTPEIAQTKACLVIDGYDPILSEWLFITAHVDIATQQASWHQRMIALTQQYLMGDLFLCASERQRDWWLGLLEAHGRINAHTFRQDATLRKLVDVVPFGLPSTTPTHTQSVIKGVWDGIAAEDKLLLWGGGLWSWLDPLTAIRAVHQATRTRTGVRLVFPGTKHPNPILNNMHTKTEAAKALATELGVMNKHVFFGDWLPYDQWPNVLLESDLALSLHEDTLESRMAFRSRTLEYIWANLPTIATQGDATSELIAQHSLGIVVDYQDVNAVSSAILQLLDEPPQLRKVQFEQAKLRLTWERAAEPLIAFCKNPQYAADRINGESLGNPLYLHQQNILTQQSKVEIDRWQAQAHQSQNEAAAWQAQAHQSQNEAVAWQAQAHQSQNEIKQWQHLVSQYEQGKFMRLMKWLKRK